MDERDVVTVFLRHGSDVLLLERSDEVGSYAGRWDGVAGHAEGDPDAAAREEIREETEFDPTTDASRVRAGEPFPVEDETLGVRWVVHPFLFDADRRDVTPNEESAAWEWVPPTAILRRETVPDLWTSYEHVRPTVETVADDRERGSAWLSYRALEVLRDETALAVEDAPDARDWAGLRDLATDLVAARPAMPVVRNRVDRAMATAIGDEEPTTDIGDGDGTTDIGDGDGTTGIADGDGTTGIADGELAAGGSPAALERAAEAGLERAREADDDAAAAAAERVAGARVATLSRSETVLAALQQGRPVGVLVAESRPGREGIDTAEALSDAGLDVTLTSDAALAAELDRWAADGLLVGADAVLPDGAVVNKVGTRSAAIAATHEGLEVLAVAATDKVAADAPGPGGLDLEPGAMGRLYEGDRPLAVTNPTFDVTPPGLLDAILTEDGPLAPADVGEVADRHRERARWRREV